MLDCVYVYVCAFVVICVVEYMFLCVFLSCNYQFQVSLFLLSKMVLRNSKRCNKGNFVVFEWGATSSCFEYDLNVII